MTIVGLSRRRQVGVVFILHTTRAVRCAYVVGLVNFSLMTQHNRQAIGKEAFT